MAVQLHATPDDIDLSSLGGAVWRALPRLILLSALAGAATYGVLSMMMPRYTSEAQLKLSAKRMADSFLRPKLDNQPSDASATLVDKEAVATEVIALKSRDLASRLIDDMKLDKLPEFNPALGGSAISGMLSRLLGIGAAGSHDLEEDRVLQNYYKALQVYQGKDTRVINIEFAASDPEVAANVANKLGQLYQQRLAQQIARQTQGASDFLASQIKRLTEEVRAADAEVEQFRATAGLMTGSSGSVTLNAQQLSELSSELSRTTAARSEAEARARAARDMLRRGSAEALPDVAKSPLILRLVEQRVGAERQISELSTTLLPGHPRMRQLQADLAGLNRQIQAEVGKLVDGLEKEAGVAQMREAAVKGNLDTLKRQVAGTTGDDVKLRSLESLARSKRQELESLQASFESARARGDASAVPLTAEFLSLARPSSIPTFPKKPMSSAFASVATLILGLAFVITKELLTGGAKPRQSPAKAPAAERVPMRRIEPEPVRLSEPSVPAVATPPPASVEPAAKRDPLPIAVAKTAPAVPSEVSVAEASRLLKARQSGPPGSRTLVTPAAEHGDAAAEAREIASTLRASGSLVVLVDWDTRGVGISRKIGLKSTPGATDLLTGEATFEDIITAPDDESLHFIGCGKALTSSLDPDRVNLLLDALDEAYDHVVIHAERKEARRLFETIEGRVDVGVSVLDVDMTKADDGPGRFLGFQVTDIEIIIAERVDTKMPEDAGSGRRHMQLARSAKRG